MRGELHCIATPTESALIAEHARAVPVKSAPSIPRQKVVELARHATGREAGQAIVESGGTVTAALVPFAKRAIGAPPSTTAHDEGVVTHPPPTQRIAAASSHDETGGHEKGHESRVAFFPMRADIADLTQCPDAQRKGAAGRHSDSLWDWIRPE